MLICCLGFLILVLWVFWVPDRDTTLFVMWLHVIFCFVKCEDSFEFLCCGVSIWELSFYGWIVELFCGQCCCIWCDRCRGPYYWLLLWCYWSDLLGHCSLSIVFLMLDKFVVVWVSVFCFSVVFFVLASNVVVSALFSWCSRIAILAVHQMDPLLLFLVGRIWNVASLPMIFYNACGFLSSVIHGFASTTDLQYSPINSEMTLSYIVALISLVSSAITSLIRYLYLMYLYV